MAKHIHIYVGGAKPAKTRDADDTDGHWVTINGAHVLIGKSGKIEKGPAHLIGMSEHQGNANEHAEKASQHRVNSQAKKEEGDHKAADLHDRAAKAHGRAEAHYKEAHDEAESGNIKQARASSQSALEAHREAQRHEEALGKHHAERQAAAGKVAFEKPKAHAALHADAEDDVKGSEKHEAEHKRLVKQYEGATQNWERNAINRQISNNAAAGAQAKAQALHHKALAAHEHAKNTGDIEDRRKALEHIDAADRAHGKAGGVGSSKKQEELAAMRKEHSKHVEKADKAAGKQSKPMTAEEHDDHAEAHRAQAKKLRGSGDEKGAQAHEDAAELHDIAKHAVAENMGGAHASKQAQEASAKLGGSGGEDRGAKASHHEKMADMHRKEAAKASARGKHAAADAHNIAASSHSKAAEAYRKPDASGKMTAGEHGETAMRITNEVTRKHGGPKMASQRAPRSSGNALEKVAGRVASRVQKEAEDSANVDPKAKK